MIPQERPDGWTAQKLRRIARERWPVVVRGQLLYDNKHEVNDDPDDVKSGEPKRFSLWEVHPVTEFYVCMTANKRWDAARIRAPQWRWLEQLPD